MKSVPKGLLAALAGLAVVVAMPCIMAWEGPGRAGGGAVEGMEVRALSQTLPEGYRVEAGGELRFLSPEALLAGLAGAEWDRIREEEGAEEALGVWCVLTHSRLLGEMGDQTADGQVPAGAWAILPAWEAETDPEVEAVISRYCRYFLSADGALIREEAALTDILHALQAGESPAELYRKYGGENAVLEMAAEK